MIHDNTTEQQVLVKEVPKVAALASNERAPGRSDEALRWGHPQGSKYNETVATKCLEPQTPQDYAQTCASTAQMLPTLGFKYGCTKPGFLGSDFFCRLFCTICCAMAPGHGPTSQRNRYRSEHFYVRKTQL